MAMSAHAYHRTCSQVRDWVRTLIERALAPCVPIAAMDANQALGVDTPLDAMLEQQGMWLPQADAAYFATYFGNTGSSFNMGYLSAPVGWGARFRQVRRCMGVPQRDLFSALRSERVLRFVAISWAASP